MYSAYKLNKQGDTPEVRGQWPRGATPHPQRPGVAAGRIYPTPEVRGSDWEEQPHVQGAVAVWAQVGREELLHVQGQKGRP